MSIKPIVLAVIDGWGSSPPWGGNAISLAKTPFLNWARQNFPHSTLQASGEAVGLPPGERGNSEVGHLTIGAGQIVNESLPAITTAINDKTFFSNEILIAAMDRVKGTDKAVHLLGLVSDGGIHSHINHLFALLELAKQRGVENVCVHAITDGRDTPPFTSQEYFAQVNSKFKELGIGRFCTVSGRYYAMDRDHRWDRIERTYRAMVEGVGPSARSAEAAAATSYRDGFSDEFILPTVIQAENNTFRALSDGDSLIFFNFRGDRAREISQAIAQKDFKGFDRKKFVKDIYFAGFTFYQEGLPVQVAFKPRDVTEPLAVLLSRANLKQLHVAESEKYAHVTYFFNAGSEKPFKGEDRIVIPSPDVSSYDQVPEMSCAEIAKTVVKNIGKYDFIVLNFAAPDMVGHTGNLRAAVRACEAVDAGLKEIFEAVTEQQGIFFVTADHGNVEQLVNPKTGEPDTEHSNNPVPLYLIGEAAKQWQLRDGSLADVAPTILSLLGISPAADMTGKNLITSSLETAGQPLQQSSTQV